MFTCHIGRINSGTFPLSLGRRSGRRARAEVLVEGIVKVLNGVRVVSVLKLYCDVILAELSINNYTAHSVPETED
jgi:hypothetical protein